MADIGLLFRSLLQQANMQGWKSTALNPHNWALILMGTTLVAALAYHAPTWLLISLTIFFGVFLCNWIFSHNYLLLNKTDALRSERYTLTKMQIEKSVTGDSVAGFAHLNGDDPIMLTDTKTATGQESE